MEKKLLTKRIGQINPLSIDDAIKHGGYEALKSALNQERLHLIETIEQARLRGRGGAAFPMHIKMMSMAKQTETTRYLICNADEGEPGNFKDRYLMEHDPHQMIEGMIIAAYAIRATKGYIYIRGEFDKPIAIMHETLKTAREHNMLGKNILGTDFSFDIEIRTGAGSYVCGEEFALIESIEGKAGRTRVKPPFPTDVGLFGKPTLINNVETFSNLPWIISMGSEEYAKIGTKSSTGTKLVSLSGNIKHPGVYEVPFGVPIRDVVDTLGGGTSTDRPISMIQLSGASGPIIPEYMMDLTIDFDRFEDFDSKTGAGAIIVMDDEKDMFDILSRLAQFFEHESCGKCTPCREGNVHTVKLLEKFIRGDATESDLMNLESLARVMHQTSLCGLGQSAPTAIISTLKYFRDTYFDRIEHAFEGGRA